ncbi:hypothetical protein PENTCL1PPCAC_28981, partial [Pristionchus entomophagus]
DDETARKPHKCEICGRRFAHPSAFKIHKKTHLDENDPAEAAIKRPHKCAECGKTLTSAQNLRKHHISEHLTVKRPLLRECGICGKICTTAGNLRTHEKTHLPDGHPDKGNIE